MKRINMKKMLPMVATVLAMAGCSGSGADGYKGMTVSKALVESFIQHAAEFQGDSQFKWSFHDCGEYVAMPREGFNTCILVDKNGEIAYSADIPYDNFGEFSNGVAVLYDSSTPFGALRSFEPVWQLINAKGEKLLPEPVQLIGPWMGGNAFITKDNKMGVISDKVEMVVPYGKYPLSLPLENGLILVGNGTRIGLLDGGGSEVQPLEYQGVQYGHGLVFLKKGTKWGAVDKNAKEVIPFDYDEVYIWAEADAEHYLGVLEKSGERCYITTDVEVITQAKYEEREREGSDEPKIEDRSYDGETLAGVVDAKGKELIPHKYWEINLFRGTLKHGGFYIAKKDKKGEENDIYRLDGKKTHSITEAFRGGGEFLNSAYIIAGGIAPASTEKTYFFDREGNYLFTVDGMFEATNEGGTNYVKRYQVDDVMARILRRQTNVAP